jgi:hypothetical protein
VALFNRAVPTAEQMAAYHLERAALPPGPPQLDLDVRRLFVEPMPHLHAAVQEQLQILGATGQPVVVLHDTTFTGLWPVLLGAPGLRPAATIGLGVIPLTISSVDTAPFGLGLPPDASPEGHARNAGGNTAVRESFAPSEHLTDQLSRRSAAPRVPRSHRRHGRSARPVPAAHAAGWSDVLDADRVVVVTQGTLANRDLSDLIEPTLSALADLNVLVVATTGRSDATVADIPGNARVASFIPYSALLPHADVLLTNGGYGGALQALDHGVPLVGWRHRGEGRGERAVGLDRCGDQPAYRQPDPQLDPCGGRHHPAGEVLPVPGVGAAAGEQQTGPFRRGGRGNRVACWADTRTGRRGLGPHPERCSTSAHTSAIPRPW